MREFDAKREVNVQYKHENVANRLVGEVVDDIVSGAGGLGFDIQSGQVKHCVANSSPLRPRCFESKLPGVKTRESSLPLVMFRRTILHYEIKNNIRIKVAFQTKSTFLHFYKQQKNRTN